MHTVVHHTMPEDTYNERKKYPLASQASSQSLIVEQQILAYGLEFRKPNKSPIDISFNNITYTVQVGNILRRQEKEILHSVNGRFPPRQLIAIMGPSGAGKSTLLDIISGYRITGVEGVVYTNGRIRDLATFRKVSCYIQQDDRLQPLLTVQENMHCAANLKLGVNVRQYEKAGIIEEILTTLGLYESLHTRAERLSGGQKKRLSIALELISNPLIMFLDEPTTGLDSSSCYQCVSLLKMLARQGRTIICTIHQPSASLFSIFDQVYVLAGGDCLYQGTTENLLPFLDRLNLPCPLYHNPADYAIELACGEYGNDKIEAMVTATQNGGNLEWMNNYERLPDLKTLRAKNPLHKEEHYRKSGMQETSQWNQLKVLIQRGFLKSKRDSTLTHLRLIVNILTGFMLGSVYIKSGSDGSKVLDNYNLLFAILIHHMMSTMMLTILTFPQEMSILQKEHFNRWYSLKSFYCSITIVDIPISVASCTVFTIIIYLLSAQPLEYIRFCMFWAVSLLMVFVAQSFGLMVGAIFDVVNGTFVGPTFNVPMMMFAGFGVTLRDLPSYLYWGSYLSYLRYAFEGYVSAIYGMNRQPMECPDDKYCHYRYPEKLLSDMAMRGDHFWYDIAGLCIILFIYRALSYCLLKWKLVAVR